MPTQETQKFVYYVLPDKGSSKQPGHPFLVGRKTTKNSKGRFVTGDEFYKVGLFWGTNPHYPTRDDLALDIGRKLLDEAKIIEE
jgi:hypothetical protein